MRKSALHGYLQSDVSLQNQSPTGFVELECIPLLLMYGTFNEILARILEDDSCTANVVSRELATIHHQKFTFSPVLVDVNHSKQVTNEIATEMIANGTIKKDPYSYSGNWIFADCRYDVLMGMLWQMDAQTHADYVKRTLLIVDQLLRATVVARSPRQQASNLQVKRFPGHLRRPKPGMEVFRVFESCSSQLAPSPGAKA